MSGASPPLVGALAYLITISAALEAGARADVSAWRALVAALAAAVAVAAARALVRHSTREGDESHHG